MEIVKQERSPLVNYIEQNQIDAIKKSLPSNLSFKKFERLAANFLISASRQLINLPRIELVKGLLKVAELGLIPGSDCYIYPKGNTCLVIPSPQGIRKKAGEVGANIYSDVVYENDVFDFCIENGEQKLIHRPAKLGNQKGKKVGAYACCKINGELLVEVVDMEHIGKCRTNTPPWKQWEDQMIKKTAIHQLFKRIPGLEDVQEYYSSSESSDTIINQDTQPQPQPQPKIQKNESRMKLDAMFKNEKEQSEQLEKIEEKSEEIEAPIDDFYFDDCPF